MEEQKSKYSSVARYIAVGMYGDLKIKNVSAWKRVYLGFRVRSGMERRGGGALVV